MSKKEALIRYKTSMAIFKQWLANGAITEADLLATDTIVARKYSLSSRSIFLENDLLCRENRVIYGSAKGDRYEQKDYET